MGLLRGPPRQAPGSGSDDPASRSRGRAIGRVAALLLVLAWAGPDALGAAAEGCVVTPAEETAWGEETFKEFTRTHPDSDSGTGLELVLDLGRRLAQVSDRPHQFYEFHVVEGEELQAFSFPGGRVCITESLLEALRSDDELAFTIGHELAHIALRHHAALICIQKALIDNGVDPGSALEKALADSFDLNKEAEADRFGAMYATRAGFEYSASYRALQRIMALKFGPGGHPALRTRIAGLQQFQKSLTKAVEAFNHGVEALRIWDFDEAIGLFKLYVADFPGSAAGRLNLGTAYLGRVRQHSGTPQGLVEPLWILPDPDQVPRSYQNKGDLMRARENFERALQFHPRAVLARAGLGLVHTYMGALDEARSELQRALVDSDGKAGKSVDHPEADRDRCSLLVCLGNVEYLAGNYAEAERLYRQSLQVDASCPGAASNLRTSLARISGP